MSTTVSINYDTMVTIERIVESIVFEQRDRSWPNTIKQFFDLTDFQDSAGLTWKLTFKSPEAATEFKLRYL